MNAQPDRDPDRDREILAQLAPVSPNAISAAQRAVPLPAPSTDPRALVQRSVRELKVAAKLGRADQSETGQERHRARAKTLRASRTAPVSASEMVGMCSDLARRFYKEMDDTTKTDSQTKHVATSFAIIADKLSIWTGRPTNPQGYEEAESARPALLALAAEIARSCGG